MPVTTFPSTLSTNNVYFYAENANYNVAHDGDADFLTINAMLYAYQRRLAGKYHISRVPLQFDTSPLGAGAEIISAYLAFVLHGKFYVGGHDDLVVVDATGLVFDGTFYRALLDKTTSHGLINTADLPEINESFQINLNALGLAIINKTGITKFGMRLGRDISATPQVDITGVRTYAGNNGEGWWPTITIEYTPAPAVARKGNIVIDQLIYKHAERMRR